MDRSASQIHGTNAWAVPSGLEVIAAGALAKKASTLSAAQAAPADSRAARITQVLGYHILEVLGRAGKGVVYKARRPFRGLGVLRKLPFTRRGLLHFPQSQRAFLQKSVCRFASRWA